MLMWRTEMLQICYKTICKEEKTWYRAFNCREAILFSYSSSSVNCSSRKLWLTTIMTALYDSRIKYWFCRQCGEYQLLEVHYWKSNTNFRFSFHRKSLSKFSPLHFTTGGIQHVFTISWAQMTITMWRDTRIIIKESTGYGYNSRSIIQRI